MSSTNISPPGNTGDDWDTVYAGTSSGFATAFVADGVGTAEKSFFTGGGSKDTNDIPQWLYDTVNDVVPDKDDIENAFAAAYDRPSDGHVISDNIIGELWSQAAAAGCDVLAYQEVCTFGVVRTVLGTDPDPLINEVNVLYHPAGYPNDIRANDTHSANLFQPSVKVTKTGDALSKVGDAVTYHVVITNTSSADAPDLVLDAISDDVLGDLSSYAAACASLAPNAECSFDVPWTVAAVDVFPQDGVADDPVVNTVTVHLHPDTFPNDITTTASHKLNLFQPRIVLTKVADTELSKATDDVKYTIREGGVGGTGNLDADPRFVKEAARNYRLAAGSPAINSGGLPQGPDLIGLARPQGPAADMGAYEFTETAPPVSTATVTGTLGTNGIYVTPVTVAIAATDAYGVREIRYTVNGTETVIAGATASFTLSASGTYAVSYHAVDAYGNSEAVKTLPPIVVDVTAPAVVTSTPAAGATGVSRSTSVVVTFSETLAQGPSFAGIVLKRNGSTVATTKTISGATLTVRPSTTLNATSTFTLTVPAGAVIDAAGNANAAYTLSFTTGR